MEDNIDSLRKEAEKFAEARGYKVMSVYFTDNHDPRPGFRRIWARALLVHKITNKRRRAFKHPNGWRWA